MIPNINETPKKILLKRRKCKKNQLKNKEVNKHFSFLKNIRC